MGGTPSVAEVLEQAADRLSKPGQWGQGSGPCKGQHCADTMIYTVAYDRELREKSRKFFAKHIGGATHFDTYRWNDAKGRTQEEVVAKLREAADLARAEQVQA